MSPILSARGGMSAGAYGWGAASSAGGTASFESIATSTPTTGLSVTFSSIPSTFKHLQIRGQIVQQSGAPSFSGFQFNGDTGTNYNEHYLVGGAGGTLINGGLVNNGQIDGDVLGGGTLNFPIVFVLDILDYTNTSKYKTTRLFLGQDNNSGGSSVQINSGVWRNTSAITSIVFKGSGSVNFASGTSFALYGMKESA